MRKGRRACGPRAAPKSEATTDGRRTGGALQRAGGVRTRTSALHANREQGVAGAATRLAPRRRSDMTRRRARRRRCVSGGSGAPRRCAAEAAQAGSAAVSPPQREAPRSWRCTSVRALHAAAPSASATNVRNGRVGCKQRCARCTRRALQQQDARRNRGRLFLARAAGGTACPHQFSPLAPSLFPCTGVGSSPPLLLPGCVARARARGVRMVSGRALSRPSDRADGGGDASTSGSGSERLSHKLLAPLWRVSAALARQGSADNTILAGTLARTAAQARAAAALHVMLAAR
jgi:hypothetical protein